MASKAAKALRVSAKSKAATKVASRPSGAKPAPKKESGSKAASVLNTAKQKAKAVNSSKDGKRGSATGSKSGKDKKPSQGNATARPTVPGRQSSTTQGQARPNYTFGSVPGNLYNENIGNLVDLGNKYADNETIGGMVAGTLANTFATGANMGLAVQYNDAFLGSMGKYQGNLENLRTGNTMKIMGAEAGLARDLVGVQGQEERLNISAQGKEDRLSRVTQGEQDRLGYVTQGQQERLNIGAQGSEDRKKLQEEASQTIRLRRDARGAIRSTGSRFFG
jgi:hypothetical protein